MAATPSGTLESAAHRLGSLLVQLWGYLSLRRRFQLCVLLVLMLVSSLAEVLSLAAVLPFLSVLASPDEIWNRPFVQRLTPWLGIENADELLLPITILFAFAAVAAGTIRLLNLWANGRLAAAIGSDLSCEAYRRTLYQPYSIHLMRNSSTIISSIHNDVSRLITLVINPLLLMLSSGIIALSLIITLLVINPAVALQAGLFIALVYAVAIAVSKRPLQRIGDDQVVINRRLIQVLQEGLGAIRDIVLNGDQEVYSSAYRRADRRLRRGQADIYFLSSSPRLILEPVGMALIAFLGYSLVQQLGVGRALPLLGAMAVGAQRILPMAQKVYEGWAQTRSATASLDSVMELLLQPLPSRHVLDARKPIDFRVGIRFEAVSYRYRSESPNVLNEVDLEIRCGECIGLIGSTGSGKSTMLDLLMGLLIPSSGRILVDGQDLHDPNQPEKLIAWQSAIAHVPQTIYLADCSIAENIAFGTPKNKINIVEVRRAAQLAQIASYIENTPHGYEGIVGERGVRLSGGQRQRIGIARALYKRAPVMVFDEATSALDMETEKAIISALEKLEPRPTLLMVAHRLQSLQNCDRIIHLDCKRIDV